MWSLELTLPVAHSAGSEVALAADVPRQSRDLVARDYPLLLVLAGTWLPSQALTLLCTCMDDLLFYYSGPAELHIHSISYAELCLPSRRASCSRRGNIASFSRHKRHSSVHRVSWPDASPANGRRERVHSSRGRWTFCGHRRSAERDGFSDWSADCIHCRGTTFVSSKYFFWYQRASCWLSRTSAMSRSVVFSKLAVDRSCCRCSRADSAAFDRAEIRCRYSRLFVLGRCRRRRLAANCTLSLLCRATFPCPESCQFSSWQKWLVYKRRWWYLLRCCLWMLTNFA